MKYILCLKEVPNTKEVSIDPITGSLKRDIVGSILNPNDEDAISLCKKTQNVYKGEFVAITMGPKQSRQSLRRALSFGATKAYHLRDDAFRGSDVYATAYTLKQGISKIGMGDIIFCGQQSIDGDTGQVPVELAAMLNIECIGFVSKIIEIKDNNIIVETIKDNKVRTLKTKLPVVISVLKMSQEKIESSYKDKIKARKKEIEILQVSSLLDANPMNYGPNSSLTKVVRTFSPTFKANTIYPETFNLPRDIKKLEEEIKNEDQSLNKRLNDGAGLKDKEVLIIFDDNSQFISQLEIASKINSLMDKGKIHAALFNFDSNNVDYIRDLNFFNTIYSYKSKFCDDEIIREAILNLLIENEDIEIVLASSNDNGRMFMPWIAAKLKAGITADCMDLSVYQDKLIQIRPAFSESLYAMIHSIGKYTFATIREGVFDLDTTKRVEKTIVIDRQLQINKKIEVIDEVFNEETKDESKDIVLIIGNAISSKDQFTKLIEKIKNILNVDIGVYTTRPLTQGQISDKSMQVGISGKNIKAKIAIVIGASGSTQTLAGVVKVAKIIAINTNKDANIFNVANIGYIFDYNNLLEEA